MKDMEEEAKREKKLKEYNKKADEIKRRLWDRFYHGTAHTNEMSQMDSGGNGSPGGISGLDEYDSYGPGGYQSAIDYNNEIEIQEKIRKHEEKMSRAHFNRLKRLEEQRATL